MVFSSLAGDDWSICDQNKKAPTVQGLKNDLHGESSDSFILILFIRNMRS